LLEEGARLIIYDPKVSNSQIKLDLEDYSETQMLEEYSNSEGTWSTVSSVSEATINTDAIIVLTEWSVFSKINWVQITHRMRKPSWLFDTRSVVNLQAAESAGLNVWRLGMDSG